MLHSAVAMEPAVLAGLCWVKVESRSLGFLSPAQPGCGGHWTQPRPSWRPGTRRQLQGWHGPSQHKIAKLKIEGKVGNARCYFRLKLLFWTILGHTFEWSQAVQSTLKSIQTWNYLTWIILNSSNDDNWQILVIKQDVNIFLHKIALFAITTITQ